MLLTRAPLLAALLCCGCPTPGPPPVLDKTCVPGVVGNASAALELELLGLDLDGSARELRDGDPLFFHIPGQGGYVLFAGAGARNLQGCGAFISAQLLDPATGQALTNKDERPVDFQVKSNGFWVPKSSLLTSQLANIPACPDALGKGLTEKPATLQVTVQDTEGRSATLTRSVVPTCSQSDTHCACVCGPNYKGGC